MMMSKLLGQMKKTLSHTLFCIGFLMRVARVSLFLITMLTLVLPATAQHPLILSGEASYYGVSTNGTVTASGEPLNDDASTAAHRTLPFGTKVKVTNVRNGRSEVVRITDRGPFEQGRIIDVTKGVAEKLGFLHKGVASVKIEVISEK